MITDFRQFGCLHIVALLLAILTGVLFIVLGLRASTDEKHRKISLLFAAVIIVVRAVRYIMDVYFGVFEWPDLFSLHICHIDLILLVICLIKPNRTLFHFCFLVGIPMGLAVALFPGTNHPAPGIPRALLFIMSHTMLVMGALYLAAVVRLKLNFKVCASIAAIGSLLLIPLYFINEAFSSNYLYIMKAPSGTVIELFERLFGWPGYVVAMDLLAVSLMLLMFLIGNLISGRDPQQKSSGDLPA